MKAPITVVLAAMLLGLSQLSVAQVYQKEMIVYLDADGHPTKEKKAVQLHQIIRFSDTLWEFNIYPANKPRIKSFRTSDAAGKVLNGRYVSYTASGQADTVGEYVNSKRNGRWIIFSPAGRSVQVRLYRDDELIGEKDTVEPQRDPGIEEPTEAKFPGSGRDWLRFLNQNLRYPDEAVNKNLQGTVILTFMVDSAGYIPLTSVWVSKSASFSLDRETIRVISVSPLWNPATLNGHSVNSFKRQPMVFSLESK